MKIFTIVIILITNIVFGQFAIDVETGIAGTTYNDIRIPGDTGTSLSLVDDLKDRI
ncbi:MAG: hypothetical protein PF574_04355 [Candidatus Delongbacteria bacterium]|jgi:hypothetical protein|nr:hypothetical protein [Candidatus Delongbacteria bacterium]